MGVLYKLTSPSRKSYIGISSKSLNARWEKHVEHAIGKRDAGALYAALRKYGPENFTKEVLAECDNWEELCVMEIAAICSHGSLSPGGYNMTTGGEGAVGRVMDERARLAISVAQKKRFQRPEERKKMRQNSIIARNSPKTKAANLRRRKPKPEPITPEEKSRRVKEAMERPEVRAKVLACARKRAASLEWRKKVGDSKRGITTGPCTEQRRRLVSEARKREWADPVIRERRLAALAKARAAKSLGGQVIS